MRSITFPGGTVIEMSDLSDFGADAHEDERDLGDNSTPESRDAGADGSTSGGGDIDWAGVGSRTVAETTLINLHDLDDTASITRVDRTSRFGNPYTLIEDGGEYTREESVSEYRLWFAYEVANNEEFRDAVEDLHGETLGCWCVPEDCHGDVLLEYLSKAEGLDG